MNVSDLYMKALIIDDEPDSCLLLSRLLKNKNVDTVFVNSLAEADSVKVDPEIIFLDNHLPDGLGINYISTIKGKFPKAKVVMITAHDIPEDREQALKNGADLFIGKPFSKSIIFNAVETVSH